MSSVSAARKPVIARYVSSMHSERVDEAAAKEIWETLATAIDDIYNKNISHYRFEVLHRSAYKLVLHKHGEYLYRNVSDAIQKHLVMFLAQLLPCSDDTLLATLADRWSDHQIMTVRIQEILLYLERNYIPQHKKLSTYNLGLVLFRRVIVENPQLQPRITSLLLHNVAVDRAGGVTADSGVMRRVTSMLIELSSAATSSGGGAMSTTSSSNTNSNGCAISNVYHDVFERPFLDATSSYFRSAAQVLVSSRTCMECLVEIERRLVSEAKRAEQYLSESTGRKLIRLVELELIERTAKDLVSMQDSGVASMIRDKRFGELRLLYSLLSRVPMTLDYLRVCLEDFIRTSGSSIYSCQANTNDSVKFVEDLSAMMTTLTVLIDTCFASDNKLQAKINTALDELFSRDSILTVHHIVMYSDEQLRNGLKSASDTEVDVVLARIVALLRHVRDKDVFESYYKTHLSRRLLGSRSSEDVERQIVLRLKAEYGYQFTLKIERMFSDMSISRALMSDFKLSQYKTECPIECDFTVLTAGYWPAQRHSDDFIFPASYAKTASGGTSSSEVATGGSTGSVSVCNACMPPSVRACMDAFTSFYVAQHSGRRLTWQLSQASADTRLAINDANKYLVSMSAYQMMIFHLLNSSDSVTYEEISSLVRIPELELKRQLLSLCTPKLRLLNKSSPGRVINPEDQFSINHAFTSKLKRFKVPMLAPQSVVVSGPPGAGGVAEGSVSDALGADAISGSAPGSKNGASVSDISVAAVPQDVLEDRKYAIDSAIVRIMKGRKALGHNDLVAEVTQQLSSRFNPTPQLLRTRIESLIEREYLSRDQSIRSIYHYVA